MWFHQGEKWAPFSYDDLRELIFHEIVRPKPLKYPDVEMSKNYFFSLDFSRFLLTLYKKFGTYILLYESMFVSLFYISLFDEKIWLLIWLLLIKLQFLDSWAGLEYLYGPLCKSKTNKWTNVAHQTHNGKSPHCFERESVLPAPEWHVTQSLTTIRIMN